MGRRRPRIAVARAVPAMQRDTDHMSVMNPSRERRELPAYPSRRRRNSGVFGDLGHAELAQFLHQSSTAKRKQAGRVRDRATRTLERLGDEAALDDHEVRAKIDALLGQT